MIIYQGRTSRRVGMADEADSKSVVGNNVRVQVPLPAFVDKPGARELKVSGFFVYSNETLHHYDDYLLIYQFRNKEIVAVS